MKLYEISDDYIKYLKKIDGKVLDNHFVHHNRKYLGLGVAIDSKQYYIPLSHPDPTDYVNGKVRPSVVPIFRLVSNSGKFLGKLLLNNMIPAPESELSYYDTSKEADKKYKNLVLQELRIIKKNMKKIIKNANLIYNQKKSNMSVGYLKATVDYVSLEKAMAKYSQKEDEGTKRTRINDFK